MTRADRDELVDAGTIRLVDVLILTKDEHGSVDAIELSDVAELGELQALETQLADLLAAEDVAHLAAALDPGSTAVSASEFDGRAISSSARFTGKAEKPKRSPTNLEHDEFGRGIGRSRHRTLPACPGYPTIPRIPPRSR